MPEFNAAGGVGPQNTVSGIGIMGSPTGIDMGLGTLSGPGVGQGVGQVNDRTGILEPGRASEILGWASQNVQRMVLYRRQYDPMRAAFYKQYVFKSEQRYFPDNMTPRSNTFVPYTLSNVETVTAHIMDAFFSFDPPFETIPRRPHEADAASKMQITLHYMLHRSRMIQEIELLIRNLAIYGHAGFKVDWDWGFETVSFPEAVPAINQYGQPIVDPNTGQPQISGYRPAVRRVPRNCPKFTAVDTYDMLVDPDGTMAGHLIDKTWGELRREAEANPNLYLPEAMNILSDDMSQVSDADDVIVRLCELWDSATQTRTVVTTQYDSDALGWKDLRASFRAAAYSSFRRNVYAKRPILMNYGSNPFMHRRVPLLWTSYVKVPGEIFGLGQGEIIADLECGLNNMVNMITDNWDTGINRRYAYDINMDIDHDALNNANVPGGKVGVSGDPSKVIFPLPFFTPNPGDYQILDLYRGMIEVASGLSDFYSKGMGTPGSNRTATGIAQVMQESNTRIRMLIRNLELDILEPTFEMCASMIQQFMTDPLEVQITGSMPGIPKFPKISPDELIGNFMFRFVGANYSTNKTIKQRNMMALTNILSKTPYVNQYEALRELLKAYEIRNLDKILKTPQEVEQEREKNLMKQREQMAFTAVLQAESKAAAKSPAIPALQSLDVQSGLVQQGPGRPPQSPYAQQGTPGVGLSSAVREWAQSVGANGNGMAGDEGVVNPQY